MASTRAVWGIDIGQCAFKALRVRAVGDKIEALAHEYIEHPKILSQPDADRPALVAKALEQFLSKHDVRQDRVVVGVPGQHTLSRFTKLPPVEEKKIPDIVRFEANQQIPFDMDEVVWDWQTFRTGEAGDLEVGIFAMRRELVAEHLQPFAKANIEPVVVQSAPLALYNALRYDGQLAEGATLLLDIGAQNTDLVVAEPTSLWTRNIPIGGNNFTEALLKTFKISFAKAESLKRTAASSKYARQIFQAMRPVFADLVAEIQRSTGFYSSTHRGTRITKVVGMGNAFKLPGLQKFLQSNLGLDVIRPSTFSKLSVASAQNAPQLIEHLLSFGVAYGLALQGLGLTQITSNLLPPEIAKAIIWRRKIPWFWGAAAC
ncbi:MAG TPA: type IV pilus assembly protein PilM, partial [Phycisphaerae bacterium]|nr:type IV pilus assembly protein PilM [Phycisphaerae bacterium]